MFLYFELFFLNENYDGTRWKLHWGIAQCLRYIIQVVLNGLIAPNLSDSHFSELTPG